MTATPQSSAAWRSRTPALGLLALAALAAGYGLARALVYRVPLQVVLGTFLLRVEVALLLGALAACVAALALELRDSLAGRARPSALAPLRRLFVVLVAAWVLFLAFVQPFQRLWFDLALGLAAGAWAGLMLLERQPTRIPPRALRALDLGAFSLGVALLGLELGLRGVAAVRPAPVFARVGEGPRRLIERFRCAPGELRFGFPCNANGYYDEELAPPPEGQPLVVAIGDSFHVGAVPHARHLTTVCEERLGVPVHNLGVAGVGPPEYLCMLVDDALPLDPDLVVISVFVGNDLTVADVESGLPDQALRGFLQRERVLLWVVPNRLARLAAERKRRAERPGPVAGVQGAGAQPASDAQLEASFPWLVDPRLEEPTLSPEAYLRLETQRAIECCRADPVSFAVFCEVMLAAQEAAGSTRLCVMLIPDEYQVEDGLWAQVLAGAGGALDRDRPQRLVTEWLAHNGIPCLDLLPVLRAVPPMETVPPMEQGSRHLFHLRDTHFNARGNRVAGEALAEFLQPLLLMER